jgi:hypothetical protein
MRVILRSDRQKTLLGALDAAADYYFRETPEGKEQAENLTI